MNRGLKVYGPVGPDRVPTHIITVWKATVQDLETGDVGRKNVVAILIGRPIPLIRPLGFDKSTNPEEDYDCEFGIRDPDRTPRT